MNMPTASDVTGQVSVNKQLDTNSGSQAPAQEATKPEPHDPLSPKFAALARQQKTIREEQRRVAAEKAAIEAQRKEIDEAKSWKQRLTQDPYGVMLESGLTADQVAALMLNQPNPGDQQLTLIQRELKAAQEEIQRLKSGQEEGVNRQLDTARKQILHDVKSIVATNEAFEAVKTYGEVAEQAVVELIEKTFNEDGYVMDTQEAIQAVEDQLIEEAMKAARIKKVQTKLAPPPAQPEAQQQQQVPQKPQTNTLSNRMVPSAAKPTNERERRDRAIKAFLGHLT